MLKVGLDSGKTAGAGDLLFDLVAERARQELERSQRRVSTRSAERLTFSRSPPTPRPFLPCWSIQSFRPSSEIFLDVVHSSQQPIERARSNGRREPSRSSKSPLPDD
jgi:hypothetical protein